MYVVYIVPLQMNNNNIVYYLKGIRTMIILIGLCLHIIPCNASVSFEHNRSLIYGNYCVEQADNKTSQPTQHTIPNRSPLPLVQALPRIKYDPTHTPTTQNDDINIIKGLPRIKYDPTHTPTTQNDDINITLLDAYNKHNIFIF